MKSISLDMLTFPTFATAGWGTRGLTDWFGQVSNKLAAIERPQTHGAFPASRTARSGRAVSFDVYYLGSSHGDAVNAADLLTSVGADVPVRLSVVDDEDVVSWRTVTVETAQIDDFRSRSEFTATVHCFARDSRRYESGAPVVTGPPAAGAGRTWPAVWPLVWPGAGGADGRITLVNPGNAPSSPVFTLQPGFDTATITCVDDGSWVRLVRPSSSAVVIDYGTKRATIGGADVSQWLRGRQWIDVPAGGSLTFQFDVTGPVGSPQMSGVVNPARW